MKITEMTDKNAYEYLLPDHWIRKSYSYWQIIHDSYANYVVNRLRKMGAESIVEVGCGDGWNCGQAVKAGLKVVGFDWSKNAIDHASRMVPAGTFLCADIREDDVLSKYEGSFDGAMFIEVLEHIPPDDCISALKNIKELLRYGGVLVLTTPSKNTPRTNPQHFQHFTEETVREVVEASGFKVEDVVGYGDIRLKKAFYRWSRFVDNRYWLIKPLKLWLMELYAPPASSMPVQWCEGLIVTAKKV